MNHINKKPSCEMIPNSMSLPNLIVDYWMAKLSPAEFKVLICICRKTYGWNKERDKISLGQIVKLTGLSRRGIVYNLETLIEKNLVLKTQGKTQFGDDDPNEYEINVSCMENDRAGGSATSALPSANIAPPSELNALGVVQPVHQGVVQPVHPQNTIYTKSKNTKDLYSAKKEIKRKKSDNICTVAPSTRYEKTPLNISVTLEEHTALVEKHGLDLVNAGYVRLSEYKLSTPNVDHEKYTDIGRLRRWAIKDARKDKAEDDSIALKELENKLKSERLSKPQSLIFTKPTVDRLTKNMDGTPVENTYKDRF